MKNIKLFIFFFLLMNIFIINTYASTCNLEEENLYKSNSNSFKVSYDYDRNTYFFSTYLFNPLPDSFSFKLSSFSKNGKCEIIDEYTSRCSNLYAGDYDIDVVSNVYGCVVDTIKLHIPFNAFYLEEVCNGIEDFILCSPTYDKEISYEEFVSRVNTYKKNLPTSEDTPEINEEVKENKLLEIYNLVLNFIMDNLILIITIIAALILLIIIIISIIKSYKKRWRLE